MLEKLFEKIFSSPLEKPLIYEFNTSKSGTYLIKIEASAKAWWQNLPQFLRRFFADDELSAELNSSSAAATASTELSSVKLQWNGNDLKSLTQTEILISRFDTGKHQITLLPKQTPTLKSVEIFELVDNQANLSEILENKIESGDRRPWLEIQFNKNLLKELKIAASAQEKGPGHLFRKDDDDLQIELDGVVFENDLPKSHRKWYWCGRVQKGGLRELILSEDQLTGVNRLRLRADNSPKIERFVLELTKKVLRSDQEIKERIIVETQRYNFDPEILLRLAKIESNFNPLAISPNGQDKGIFQLSPPALEHIQEISGRSFDPLEAEENIEAALIYFNWLYHYYAGYPDHLEKVLAAWNRGVNRVAKKDRLNFTELPEITQKLINFVLKRAQFI